MAANWLRRTDTLDTLRLDNTILTGVAGHNGLTLYQANFQYPALTTTTSVIGGPQLEAFAIVGNLNPTPQYTNVSNALMVQANNPTEPSSSVYLTIQDTSGTASLRSVIIGNGTNGFGGFPGAANRAYRYVYLKNGAISKVENIAFVPSANGGVAGVAEVPGDVNYYFNMQVAGNIRAGGAIIAGQNSATQVGLLGSGTATLDGTGTLTIPFTSMTGSGRVMATYNAPAGPLTPLSVQVGAGSFTVYGTANASFFWMVIYL